MTVWLVNEIFECSNCGKKFKSRRAMKDHETDKHSVPLDCHLCPQIFSLKKICRDIFVKYIRDRQKIKGALYVENHYRGKKVWKSMNRTVMESSWDCQETIYSNSSATIVTNTLVLYKIGISMVDLVYMDRYHNIIIQSSTWIWKFQPCVVVGFYAKPQSSSSLFLIPPLMTPSH